MRGLFITFEGGEGSGKTTQIQILKDWFKKNTHVSDLCLTREPGGTEGAELIRGLLLNGSTGKWLPETEALLMSAARHEHFFHVIQPALQRGDVVICDRFTDSTHIYQGFVNGISEELLDCLDQLSCKKLTPDLTLFLDIDSDEGLARAVKRSAAERRFETKGEAFHQKVRQGFLIKARKSSHRIVKIDAGRSISEVAVDVTAAVKKLLVSHGFEMKVPN